MCKRRYQEPPSFSIDHCTLNAGLYLREDHKELFRPHYRVWDLRFVAPREHRYMTPAVMHSIEHLFAFKLRMLLPDQYIGFYTYGCQTGFSFVSTRDLSLKKLAKAIIELIEHTVPLTDKNDIPALTELECGQPTLFNLESTNLWLIEYKNTLCKYL